MSTGKVIVADDQQINIQALKTQLAQIINLGQNCLFFTNGENAYIKSIDIMEEELKSLYKRMKDKPSQKIEIRPISLMLLDL